MENITRLIEYPILEQFLPLLSTIGYWYLLGDTGSHNFHGNGSGAIFHSRYAHNNIKWVSI